MLKKSLAVGAVVLASILVAHPAFALNKVAAGSIICQAPFDFNYYEVAQYDADTVEKDGYSGIPDPNFPTPALEVAIDNVANRALMVSGDLLYETDLIANGVATEMGDISAVTGSGLLVGLTVDNLTGKIYAINVDDVTGENVVYVFNPTTTSFDEYMTLTSSDLGSAAALGLYQSHFYVVDVDSGKTVIFDSVSGAQTGLIDSPPDFAIGQNPVGFSVRADGSLFMYFPATASPDVAVNYFSPTSASWGENIDATAMSTSNGGYFFPQCAWWGEPEKAAVLPDTGVNAWGLGLAAAGLVGVGAIVITLHRRLIR